MSLIYPFKCRALSKEASSTIRKIWYEVFELNPRPPAHQVSALPLDQRVRLPDHADWYYSDIPSGWTGRNSLLKGFLSCMRHCAPLMKMSFSSNTVGGGYHAFFSCIFRLIYHFKTFLHVKYFRKG